MEIRRITEEDIPALIKYGSEIYPTRQVYYHNLLEFFFRDRIGERTGGLAIFDGEKICGQMFYTEMSLFYGGKEYLSSWNHDLIVNENLRKDAWGTDLLIQGRKDFKGACATGSGPSAVKLNLKLGFKSIGEIRKYVGLTSAWQLPVNLLVSTNKFPESNNGFNRVKSANDFKPYIKYHPDLVESGRGIEFMKWRFFTPGFWRYSVYQNNEGDYFVVRVIKYHHIRMLTLLDFRCDLNSTSGFAKIFDAVKRLGRRMRIPFILCGSSHRVVDQVLENHGLRSIGRPRPVLISNEIRKYIDKERVKTREFSFITFADSDGEVSWISAEH